jgi:hypothetical protein
MFAHILIRSGQSLAMIRNMTRQQVEYNKKMKLTERKGKLMTMIEANVSSFTDVSWCDSEIVDECEVQSNNTRTVCDVNDCADDPKRPKLELELRWIRA